MSNAKAWSAIKNEFTKEELLRIVGWFLFYQYPLDAISVDESPENLELRDKCIDVLMKHTLYDPKEFNEPYRAAFDLMKEFLICILEEQEV